MVATQEKITDLSNSPIFNLSMCSLEDFHTNFLAWFAKNYPKGFLTALNIKNCSFAKEVVCTQRNFTGSKKKIRTDLFIKLSENNALCIENKLKSYPTDGQLKEYQEVIDTKYDKGKNIFILLSLAEKPNLPEGWKYKSYAQLAEELGNIIDTIEQPYHSELVKDYINVIRELSNVFQEAIKKQDKKYNFYESLGGLEEVGLKNIYIKYRTDELCDFIYTNIQNQNINNIWPYNCFNNGKGTIGFEVELEEKKSYIGIQIEGNQYRYFFVKSNLERKKREEIVELIKNEKLWFFGQFAKPKDKNFKFNGYENNSYFSYNYDELDKNITYEEIKNKVIKDLGKLNKNLEKIKEIVNNS